MVGIQPFPGLLLSVRDFAVCLARVTPGVMARFGKQRQRVTDKVPSAKLTSRGTSSMPADAVFTGSTQRHMGLKGRRTVVARLTPETLPSTHGMYSR